MTLICAALIAWLIYKVLGPSVRIIWERRIGLRQAAWMRLTRPRLWAETKAEMKRDGEWL